jgi:hypothetical protein
MRHDNLFCSTPFRLALAFALLFVCAFLLSSFVAFDLIKKELNARYDNSTRETFRIISQTYAESDIQDLIDTTKVYIAATSDKRSIFLLQDSDGSVLAGNIPVLSVPDGWSERAGSDFGVGGDHKYRIYAGEGWPEPAGRWHKQ